MLFYLTGMTTKPEPIRTQKISQIVEERLLDLIRERGLAPGDHLPSERELMVLYEVGRPAIREAMQSLQRMGLVHVRHGERPRIAEPLMQSLVEQLDISMQHVLTHSKSSLQHLKEVRASLEAEMARIAARLHSPADISALRSILQQQAANKANAKKFLEADGELHRQIAAISGNPIFESLTYAIFQWMGIFHANLVRRPGLESLTLKEHGEIVDAIEAGDEAAAAEAMRNHLIRANDLYHQSNLVVFKN